MNYALFTPDWVVSAGAALVFGVLLTLSAVRLRFYKELAFHLLLYMSLGLLLSLWWLANALRLPLFISEFYLLLIQLTQLAVVFTFGALTLNFLKKSRNGLIGYWAVALVILLTWSALAFNFWGWNTNLAAMYPLSFDGVRIIPLTALTAGLGWTTALVTSTLALVLKLRQHQTAQYFNKLRYWLIVIILLTASSLFLLIYLPLSWAGLVLLTAGSALIGYTLLKYNLPDLQLWLNRALRYISITAIIFVILFFSLATTVYISRGAFYSIYMLLWGAALAALVLAILLPPLWKFVEQLLTRIVFGRFHLDKKQIIQRYGRSISTVLDMNRLGDTISNLMIETLGIERGIVFVNERVGVGNVSFHPLASVGVDNLTTGHFTSDSPFIIRLRDGTKTTSQYDLDMLPEFKQMTGEERSWLASLGMELFVPILRERELIGLLTFGRPSSGATYYSEDLDLMVALADQAALAIDSARLFEQLAVINQEVGLLTGQLAGLDQDKSDFLSIASHELRTPLTHIHGYSRMLLDLTEEELQNPEYVKTIIEGIAKGSDRMKDVVDLMFDVSEADEGEINLFLGPVVLGEVIDQATRPYLPALDQRRIAFQKKGLQELPTIEADGTRLMQAFENLIGNAIKYTPDGGMVTVEGRAIVLDNIGPAVEIVVADTGIGIEPKHHERIFEKFFRVDDTAHHSTGKTKFKGAGPGLGLTLVKGIAAAHGGNVWVESLGCDEVNFPGSKFFFVIPLHAIPPGKTPQSLIQTRHWRREDSKTTK